MCVYDNVLCLKVGNHLPKSEIQLRSEWIVLVRVYQGFAQSRESFDKVGDYIAEVGNCIGLRMYGFSKGLARF